jgi:hydrogenase nickel incorporation protein HypB
VVTKADLLPHVTFDLAAVKEQITVLNPSGRLLVTSATTGEGMAEWCGLLEELLAAKRAARS